MSNQFDDDIPPAEIAREGWILVRIHVPELDIFKCLQFPVDKLIWDIKQQVLASLPKELKESFNYGLFLPPANGKAGKFLDEERRLGDYPFNGPVGYLELKYKRRVYKLLNVDERQLRALHSRSNLRRFLEYVNGGHVEKISKMCSKGLDPNFHCSDTGETPLSIATSMKKPQKLLIALVNGGALLDYRSRDGSTALHKAVERDTLESVMTLLELGASPNYRDAKMLTPAYLSVLKKTDPKITEVLLHDHATLGTQDTQGWNEVHQACRNGLVHHLEHLLVYGADMNSKNSTGNTPLHVCAVNNQEACARMLLFRGANREALNFANQTPYQVAVIASNFELAELIRNYKNDDIVPIRVPPRYNPRRRSGLGCWYTLLNQSSHSGSEYISPTSSIVGDSWNNSHYHTFSRLIHITSPSSPCPSDRPFNSASSSLSESSSSHRSQEDDISFVTDKSLGDTSDVVSDSSGVGTNSESANCSIGHPSTTVVCIEKYEPQIAGHLSIQAGDIIEVVGSTDCGLLEGFIRGSSITGFFPSRCTQEVQFRQKNNGNHNNNNHLLKENIQPLVLNNLNLDNCEEISEPDASYNNTLTSQGNKNFTMSKPRTVLLHRAKRGFGFVLRGAKAASPLMQLKPSSRCPALQYLDDVDKGGVADVAGLKKGDFLLAINGEDVTCTSHEYVVELIRNSSECVTMTVLTVDENSFSNTNLSMMNGRQCSTLPRRFSGSNKMPVPPAVPRRDPKTTLSVGRARARSMVAGLEANEDQDECGISMKASSTESIHQQTQSAISTPLQPGTPIQPRTASIKSRPTSSRITAAELEDLFQRQQGIDSRNKYHSSMMTTSRFQSNCESSLTPPYTSPSKKQPLVYASIAEMKRKKTKVGGTLRGRPVDIPSVDSDLKRTFHSSPDLALTLSGSSTWTSGMLARKGHISQEDLQNLHISMQRLTFLPPPNCKPPPIPIENNQPEIGQVVKVDVSRKSEYESTSLLQRQIQQKIAAKTQAAVDNSNETVSVMSSFKPSSNTKIYASPQEINITNNNDITNNNNITSNYSSTVTKNVIINNNNEHYKSSSDYNVTKVIVTASSGNLNPYAQPGKINIEPNINIQQQSLPLPPPPPPTLPPDIPEPDYSESDDEEEANNSVKLAQNVPFTNESVNTLKRNDNQNQNQHKVIIITKKDEVAIVEKENSGSSSTGSSSIVSHSYSVDEIQRIRSGLKPSKTFPNAFQNNSSHNNHMTNEGDNSSSGVSSDQEIKMNYSNNLSTTHNNNKVNNINNNQHKNEIVQNKVVPRKEAIISTEDAPSDEDSPPLTSFQRNNSLTRKQAAIIAANRAKVLAQNQGQIVSLSQLPPPLEADSDEEVDNGKEATYIVAPPPPEFSDIVSNTRSLHIPTQQSQQYRQYASVNYMQQTQQKGVRIVGALPKHNTMPGQSPSGKIVRTNHPHHHIHHYHHQHHY